MKANQLIDALFEDPKSYPGPDTEELVDSLIKKLFKGDFVQQFDDDEADRYCPKIDQLKESAELYWGSQKNKADVSLFRDHVCLSPDQCINEVCGMLDKDPSNYKDLTFDRKIDFELLETIISSSNHVEKDYLSRAMKNQCFDAPFVEEELPELGSCA